MLTCTLRLSRCTSKTQMEHSMCSDTVTAAFISTHPSFRHITPITRTQHPAHTEETHHTVHRAPRNLILCDRGATNPLKSTTSSTDGKPSSQACNRRHSPCQYGSGFIHHHHTQSRSTFKTAAGGCMTCACLQRSLTAKEQSSGKGLRAVCPRKTHEALAHPVLIGLRSGVLWPSCVLF